MPEPIPFPNYLLSIQDAQERLGGLSRRTLFRLIARGTLGSVHVGRRTMIPLASLEAYLAELTDQARCNAERRRLVRTRAA